MNEEDVFADVFTPAAKSPEPLDTVQRMIIQNIFDTQLDKKKSYLKQLGFEVNPDDDNEYRPIGNKGEYAEIDPGFSAYFKKGGLSELAKDFGDVSFDSALVAPAVGAGAKAGGVAGGALTGANPGGIGFGAMVGTILGGAAGASVAEAVKQVAAETLLDESIPINMKSAALQALINGIAPEIGKGIRTGTQVVNRAWLKERQKAIITAATSSGQGVTGELLEKAAKNPENFTKEAVEGANGRLKESFKEIFGLDSPLQLKAPEDIRGGVFGAKINPLNEAANIEIEKLALDPRASFKVSEIKEPLSIIADRLANKFDRSQEEAQALKYIKGKIALLEKKETTNGMINFKQGREFLSAIQKDAFDRDIPGSGIIRKAVGGTEDGMRGIFDRKAAAAGSSLPEINANRSQILKTYNTIQEALTPQNIQSAFVGNDTIRKSMVRDAAAEMDQVLGTQLSQSIETGAMQRVVEQLYSNPQAFGSGRVIPEALRGAAKGALSGAGAGTAVGFAVGNPAAGAAVGALGGAARGAQRATALASPDRAIRAVGDISTRLNAIDRSLQAPKAAPLSALSQAATQAVSPPSQFAPDSAPTQMALPLDPASGASSSSLPQDDDDPFADVFK